jgi:hypothetical protein
MPSLSLSLSLIYMPSLSLSLSLIYMPSLSLIYMLSLSLIYMLSPSLSLMLSLSLSLSYCKTTQDERHYNVTPPPPTTQTECLILDGVGSTSEARPHLVEDKDAALAADLRGGLVWERRHLPTAPST